MSDLERDRKIISRVQGGDTEAFGLIYSEQYRNVYDYTLRRVAQVEDAEDLTQVTFLKVFKKVKTGRWKDKDKPLSSYVNTVSSNARIDYYRTYTNHRLVPLEKADQISADSSTDPVLLYERNLDREALMKSLTRLKPIQREAVVNRYLLEMDYSEIATMLGKSEVAVRVMVMRGLNQLRSFLKSGL